MKKLTAFCLCLVLLLGLAACNNASGTPTAEPDASTPTPTSESTPAPTQESTPTPEAENTPAPTTDDEPESGRTLVVYFSATGNTEAAASYIAALTSGDLVELEPVEPYTSDDLNWTDSNSRLRWSMRTSRCGMLRLSPIRSTIGTHTTACSSAIPSGGALPPGRSTVLSRQ